MQPPSTLSSTKASHTDSNDSIVAANTSEASSTHGRSWWTQLSIMRQFWAAIYNGNVSNTMTHIRNYFSNFAPYIHRADKFSISDLTAEEIFQTCVEAQHSSKGMDHRSPAEFSLLSLGACGYLADMLNTIELGAAWPKDLLHVRAPLLSKDTDDPYDPAAFRILMILPTVYCRWAAARLKHLQPWLQSWATPDIYAGVPLLSAEYAWFHTALDAEEAELTHAAFAGVCADVYKCFDQLIRGLIYWVALYAGFLYLSLCAYQSFQEHIWLYFISEGASVNHTGIGAASHKDAHSAWRWWTCCAAPGPSRCMPMECSLEH